MARLSRLRTIGNMTKILPLALLAACSAPNIPLSTPGRCGFWEDSDQIIADEGECVWVYMQDDSRVTNGDCPDDGNSCAMAQGEEAAIAWVEPGARGIGLRIAYKLDADGNCPVSCDMGPHVCGSSDVLPGVCVPCPDGFTPRDSDPFICPP